MGGLGLGEVGTGLGNMGQILTLLPASPAFHQAAQICVSDFASAVLSSPIGVIATRNGGRGNKFHYSELLSRHHLPCAGCGLGQLA